MSILTLRSANPLHNSMVTLLEAHHNLCVQPFVACVNHSVHLHLRLNCIIPYAIVTRLLCRNDAEYLPIETRASSFYFLSFSTALMVSKLALSLADNVQNAITTLPVSCTWIHLFLAFASQPLMSVMPSKWSTRSLQLCFLLQ